MSEKIIDILRNKKVILFGAGELGGTIYKMLLENYGIFPKYFVDNNSKLWGTTYEETPVLRPSQLSKEVKSNLMIVISSSFYSEIATQLEELGYRNHIEFINGGILLDYINRTMYEIKDNKISFSDAVLEFKDKKSLNILIEEIIFKEDYYFETSTNKPRIIDAGANFGLAVYYFKRLFPFSEIIAFEPDPHLSNILLKNIQDNNFTNVTVMQTALSNRNGIQTFYSNNIDTMAGSLTKRAIKNNLEFNDIEVKCERLSEYLKQPIHYLKLDIEGAEDIVLFEAQHLLHNVQHIFCEYHQLSECEDQDRLLKILNILKGEGFKVVVNKSHDHYERSKYKPMRYIDKPHSFVIWAKNMYWMK